MLLPLHDGTEADLLGPALLSLLGENYYMLKATFASKVKTIRDLQPTTFHGEI